MRSRSDPLRLWTRFPGSGHRGLSLSILGHAWQSVEPSAWRQVELAGLGAWRQVPQSLGRAPAIVLDVFPVQSSPGLSTLAGKSVGRCVGLSLRRQVLLARPLRSQVWGLLLLSPMHHQRLPDLHALRVLELDRGLHSPGGLEQRHSVDSLLPACVLVLQVFHHA